MANRGEVFDLMWEVLQLLGRDVQGVATDLGLTPMQAMLLDRLEDNVAAPMSELARQLHCDKSNLTGLVDGLESHGLVERTTPANDRRVRALTTTPEGRTLRHRLRHRLRDDSALLEKLSQDENDLLVSLLRGLLHD